MYVVGYPKSGNSWFCYMLAYIFNVEFDDYDMLGVYPKNNYVRQFVKAGHKHKRYPELGPVLKTHRAEPGFTEAQPVIYLVRDGRDIMVSYYHYEYGFKPTQSVLEKGITLRQRFHRLRWKVASKISPPEFSEYIRNKAPQWARHVRTWNDDEFTIVVRYEDLHADPVAVLSMVSHRLGATVDSEVISRAVEIFSFGRLSGRNKGQEKSGSFFRKGIVGDWKNTFSEEDKKFFLESTGDVLKRFGYI